jgi:predicted dehydrogenase/threonine dehydrogenase-like Zn-dependent dehydrogenase
MKQILQSPRTGEITVTHVPAPRVAPGCVLVRVMASLVSAGTERASSEFAARTILGKAAARPDLVREIVSKARRDGIISTIDAVRNRLDQPSGLGYSSAGSVVAVGEGVTDISPGDLVACAGTGFAVHAETALVPRLLVAKVPAGEHIPFEQACFATVGSVALHGLRVADVRLGETVAVIGLGLLGQLTIQLLRAAGCRALGFDPDPARAALARKLGALVAVSAGDQFIDCVRDYSRSRGADSVLITAETSSDEPVNLAAEISRDRGVVVAVGTVGMAIERKLYFEKELSFRVSRSYGPGRYDPEYEQKGRDYPVGYVRWTENRNMEAFLELLAAGKVDVEALITHRIPIEHAVMAYEVITGKAQKPFLGIVITYSGAAPVDDRPVLRVAPRSAARSAPRISIGFLGAGAFAMQILLPTIKQVGNTKLVAVCAATGVHSSHASKKFGFAHCTTDEHDVLCRTDVNTIVIATRHHLHARQVIEAMRAGKHVLCEKPLCLTEHELAEIIRVRILEVADDTVLMVGFNRRFAPMLVRIKEFVSQIREPISMHYRINAGYVPRAHWVNDPEQGGGRILGEVCHFVDLLSFLAGSVPGRVIARAFPNPGQYSGDNLNITMEFRNGSQGIITYLANGDRSVSKERLELFGGGSCAIMDDFRRLELHAHGQIKTSTARWKKDKGHLGEWRAFTSSVLHRTPPPISFTEIVASTLATQAAEASARSGEPITLDLAGFMARATAGMAVSSPGM